MWGLLALTLFSACDDREGAFIGGRVKEECNQSWPVCSLIAGCILGNESYIAGRLPGEKRIIVRLQEPSRVEASFFLKEVTGAGSESVVTYYEQGCTDRTRLEITGEAFVRENEDVGFVTRSVDLVGLGDHRLEFTSDLQANYIFKVDVTPLRLIGGDDL